MMWLTHSLPYVLPALAAVVVAWLNRRKIIEVHALVNGDRDERIAEVVRVTKELESVTEELKAVQEELGTLRKSLV